MKDPAEAKRGCSESEKPHAKLRLWQKSVDLVTELYKVTRSFPADEKFGMTAQMRRAAVSIPSNIAEGAARRSHREYQQFLFVARGSLSELDTQLVIAARLGYVKSETAKELRERLDELSMMLNGLVAYLAR
jgi:four helix bundle protein